ncbi:MAG: type I DNA topoisomerase [Candidatus Omnitrophica bacterium]|nr:type I DNA topoisomerase [Candidatus Omnitrophota bacterium]
MKKLVIVESPTKARTISKILGKDYAVFSSMGHIIDLPRSKIGVDIEQGFVPTYVVIPGKKKTLSQLKKESKNIELIYLATDQDREGEAISWHLQEHLQDKKKSRKFLRVVFHEITPGAIKEAFLNTVELDYNKVNAQQARRVLDRIVGYFLSPLLWKKVAKGLSAGRVQSVALRLIVQRERQIESFIPQEYWKIEADLKRKKADFESFSAELVKYKKKKIEIIAKEQADKTLAELNQLEYIVSSVNKREKNRNPYPPFITSTLQQDAFNKLRFTTRKTMLIAQQLYEGIEIGEEGPIGLITYMRTDSVKIADSALEQIRKYINSVFGKEHVPEKPNVYKSKKSAQEAHEAIRPTSIERTPEQMQAFLDPDQHKLYELIWKRTLASQMKAAKYLINSLDITAGDYEFSASGSILLFDGFLKVYKEEEPEKENSVPEAVKGEYLDLMKLESSQHFIVEYFPNIINVSFTAAMEEELDKVEEGKLQWEKVLHDFYDPFSKKLSFAQKNLQKEVIETQEMCNLCGKPMVIKWSRRGKFLSCSAFPDCRNAKSISSGVSCPSEGCDGQLIARRSKRGMRFYGCSNYPKCRFISKDLPKEGKIEASEEKTDNENNFQDT